MLTDLQGSVKDRIAQPLKEKQILKALVTGDGDTQVEIFDKLRHTHLSDKQHRAIYNHLTDLYVKSKEVNPDSLLSKIRLSAKPGDYEELVAQWQEILEVPVSDSVGNILDVLYTTRKNRILHAEIFGTANRLFMQNEDSVDSIVKKIADAIISMEDEKEGISVAEANRTVVERALNPEKASTGLLTGLRDWDMQFGGFKKNKMIGVAGYSGSGKTAWVIDMICRLMRRHLGKVAIQFFSLEMSEEDIVTRIICWLAEITEHQLANQSEQNFAAGITTPLSDDQRDRLLDAKAELDTWAPYLEIVYQSLDDHSIKAKGRRFALKNSDKHIIHFLDHLGEVKGNGKDNRSKFDDAMDAMKDFCRDHKATSVALIQLAKETEQSKEQEDRYYRPKKGFVMESVGVEAKCDILALLWRPGKKWETIAYDGEDYYYVRNLMFMIVEKNRGGKMGNDIIFQCQIQFNQLFDEDPFAPRTKPIPEMKPLPATVGEGFTQIHPDDGVPEFDDEPPF